MSAGLTVTVRLADADRALLARAGRLTMTSSLTSCQGPAASAAGIARHSCIFLPRRLAGVPSGAPAPFPASAVGAADPLPSTGRGARAAASTGATGGAQAALRGTSCGFLPDRLAAGSGSPPPLPRERRGLLRDTPSPTGCTP